MTAGWDPVLPQIKQQTDCLPCWERLDKLGWTSGFAVVSHGVRLGIRVNDAALQEPTILAQLSRLLPPGWQPASSPIVDTLYSLKMAIPSPRADLRRYHLLYQGVGRLARTTDLTEALHLLESDLHNQVAAQAQEELFVHAGVVGWRGRAIVIPGRSFSGKTSLTAALVKAGATYYSDEYAVFDKQGRVHPYLKPLSLRHKDGRPAGPCTAEDLGGQAGGPPLPVAMIAVTHYQPEIQFRPRKLSAGQAMMALLDNTVAAREQPQQSLQTLSAVVADASALKGKRGEAAAVAKTLLAHPALMSG